VFNHAPHVVIRCWQVIIKWSLKVLHCILRVEVPDGSYTLVPADEDEGPGGDVHYITVGQDPGQSPEVCVSACTDEGKPRFIH
jgi:hypothetical protein